MAGLPDSIRELVELSPVEDVLLPILREGLVGVQVKSLIAADQTFPLVTIRRAPTYGTWQGDARFVDAAEVYVQTFCEDPDGDEDAALLAEAVRVVLRDAWLQHKVVPGRGHLTEFHMVSAPRRVTDWATSTGPVQFADLPTGVWRYETTYAVEIKKASIKPPINP